MPEEKYRVGNLILSDQTIWVHHTDELGVIRNNLGQLVECYKMIERVQSRIQASKKGATEKVNWSKGIQEGAHHENQGESAGGNPFFQHWQAKKSCTTDMW